MSRVSLQTVQLLARVTGAMRARRDPGPVLAHWRVENNHYWWTAHRVYTQDPLSRSIISLPREPPPGALLERPAGVDEVESALRARPDLYRHDPRTDPPHPVGDTPS